MEFPILIGNFLILLFNLRRKNRELFLFLYKIIISVAIVKTQNWAKSSSPSQLKLYKACWWDNLFFICGNAVIFLVIDTLKV